MEKDCVFEHSYFCGPEVSVRAHAYNLFLFVSSVCTVTPPQWGAYRTRELVVVSSRPG